MKAIVIDHYAHPSEQPVYVNEFVMDIYLRYCFKRTSQAPEPQPAADEVLVEVHAAYGITQLNPK
jgi:hypothetical protein